MRPTAPVAPAMKMFMPLGRNGLSRCDSRRRRTCGPSCSRSRTGCSAASPRPRTSCRRRSCACTSAGPSRTRSAFLTTVTTRLAIDVLRSARVRRETYSGSWLPEPLVEDGGAVARRGRGDRLARVPRPARAPDAGRARGARPARLVRLPFADIAAILERSEDNCRQILSRARRRDRRRAPALRRRPRRARPLAARFLAAAREGDMEGLVAMLARGRRAGRRRRRQARARCRAPLHGGAGDRPGARGVLRPGRASGALTLEPASSTASPASAASTPTGALVNVVGARHRGRPRPPRSTRCSTPTSSGTSAPSRTSRCARRRAEEVASRFERATQPARA